jgi:nucleotide-binding universal stress UspA family protein
MNVSGNAGTYRRVVVGVDDTAAGLAALRRAVGLARDSGSQLVAVRSWELGLPRHGGRRVRQGLPPRRVLFYNGVQQRMASDTLVRESLRAAAGALPRDVTLTVSTPRGDPGVVLTAMAAPDDLLVVGTQPRHAMKRLVHGSVSSYCRAHARCPVVVVPAGDGQ